MIADRAAFIRAHTRALPVPHAPEIILRVADEATDLWSKTEEELGAIGLPPPYWAFAWAGGQALARYALDHPAALGGRRVLDVGAGSGLVAIAAAKAGARTVEASDVDEFALAAIAVNAELNEVGVTPLAGDRVGRDEGWEVVLAGDVAYERDMAAAMFGWFAALARRGALVLVGDPGRAWLPGTGLEPLARYRVPVSRALEDREIRDAGVFRVTPGP